MDGPKVALCILLGCGAAALGEEYAEYTAAMKANGSAYGALRKLDAKTGPEAVANAEKLGGVYENLIAFWRQRGAADAVKWAEQGKAAALQLATAAHAGESANAAAAFETLGGTCRGCHEKHREKLPDGGFRIK